MFIPRVSEPSCSWTRVTQSTALALRPPSPVSWENKASALLTSASVCSTGPHREHAGAFPQSSSCVALHAVLVILTSQQVSWMLPPIRIWCGSIQETTRNLRMTVPRWIDFVFGAWSLRNNSARSQQQNSGWRIARLSCGTGLRCFLPGLCGSCLLLVRPESHPCLPPVSLL